MVKSRTIPESMFIDLFVKRIYFDMLAEVLRIESPASVLAEVKRLKGLADFIDQKAEVLP